MHASITNASIPALFRMFADMEPIAPRSITARCALANLVARVIRISVALLFNIAKVTRSARPVQPATEAYAQVNR